MELCGIRSQAFIWNKCFRDFIKIQTYEKLFDNS